MAFTHSRGTSKAQRATQGPNLTVPPPSSLPWRSCGSGCRKRIPTRQDIQRFFFADASPVNYFRFALQKEPLIAGTGEFGCGMKITGECYNVVQNNLIMLALVAMARMADESGMPAGPRDDRRLAEKLRAGMEKYLVDRMAHGSGLSIQRPSNRIPRCSTIPSIWARAA